MVLALSEGRRFTGNIVARVRCAVRKETRARSFRLAPSIGKVGLSLVWCEAGEADLGEAVTLRGRGPKVEEWYLEGWRERGRVWSSHVSGFNC